MIYFFYIGYKLNRFMSTSELEVLIDKLMSLVNGCK